MPTFRESRDFLLANRTDYDLRQHMEASGKDLRYYDDESGEHLTFTGAIGAKAKPLVKAPSSEARKPARAVNPCSAAQSATRARSNSNRPRSRSQR